MKGQILTLQEMADYLHIHYSTAYRLVRKHRIPAFRVSSEWRFNKDEIDAWAAKGGNLHPNIIPWMSKAEVSEPD